MIDKFQGDTRWLSNFAYATFTYDYRTWLTTEHAYQAHKTLNEDAFNAVFNCDTPAQAKTMGQTIPLREDWDKVKIAIMYDINLAKFSQNTDLKIKLLETGDQILIEGNTWGDRFWGVCRGSGRNELGKILMKIRKSLA